MTANVPVLLNFFHDFIDFSSDWSIRARCIFDIKISKLKMLGPALCTRTDTALYFFLILSFNKKFRIRYWIIIG